MLSGLTANPVADAVHRTLVSETELLISLSVAVIGSLVLLMHRRKGGSFPGPILFGIVVSIALAASSVAVGFVVLGMLIELAPVIFHVDFLPNKPFSSHDFGKAPYVGMQMFALAQQIVFSLSVLVAAIVFYLDKTSHTGDES